MTPEVQQLVEVGGLVVKGIIGIAFIVITSYVKGMNKSLRVIETDINEIKVEMSANGANMTHVKERLGEAEHEIKEQLNAWISHTDKYGAGLEWAKRQAEKS